MLTSLRGKLILIFVVLTVSAVAISSGYARYMQRQFALDRAKERASVDLQLISSDIHSALGWIMRDLLVLRDLPSLQLAINAGNNDQRQAALAAVRKEFLSMAAHHQIFQQIRFLDRTGHEIIRVNARAGKTWLTPVEKLQDKSNRYYFQAAAALKQGQVYISPMDLNIEQGLIERPIMPVIRYATPVTDQNGMNKGVLILNVFGSTFLHLLDEQQDKTRHGERFFLLNSDGYFLYHPEPEKTFGFMQKTNENFYRYEPELTRWIKSGNRGIIIQQSNETSKQTLFAFQRIILSSSIAPLHDQDQFITPSPMDRTWILLTTVDDADLLVGFDEYVQSFLPFTLLLLVICIVVAVFVAWSCSRPVVSLAKTANQIKSGDFSARAQVYTSDDMGKFGNQFNDMAEKLETTIISLQRSESKYRQIFENSQDCIFVTDTHCNIVDINQAGRRLLGVQPDSPLEQLSLNCCRTDSGKEEGKPVIQQDMHATGYVKNYETTLQRPDGTVRYCVMTASARFDEHGALLGYEGILRDVTEEKLRQEAERSFQKHLQEEIVLAEERERRHIGQVLHEEMAQNLALVNMKLREAEQLTIQSTDRTGDDRNISKQLSETRQLITLMIGQIRTMIFDLYPTVLDDQGLVPAMIWYADHFTKRTGINVSVYGIPGSLGLAESQKIYLFRSFKELIHNAWKHGNTKEIVATVKKKDNHVRLTVDDEGDGFNPEDLKKTSDELKGIGLISIKQWIAAMKGTMSIESQPGKGTRVAIDIPLPEKQTA
jgi:PAS domain S-box-containing protein